MMTEQVAAFSNAIWGCPMPRRLASLHIAGSVGAAMFFVLLATMIVSGGTLFVGGSDPSSLKVGSISRENILAPRGITYESAVLTERSREEAAENVGLVYDPPDPNVSRTQSQLARQILDYIRNIRSDPYGTIDQRTHDIQQITALTLTDEQVAAILAMTADAWQAVDDEVINVLERVMRESIRELGPQPVRNQLPTQVSIRFSTRESGHHRRYCRGPASARTPSLTNQATADARQKAMDAVEPVPRSFVVNEVVVRANEPITEEDYEALSNWACCARKKAVCAMSPRHSSPHSGHRRDRPVHLPL